MAIISDVVAKIRQAIYGKDVRENIAVGIESINEEVESTTSRQTNLEGTFKQLIINAGNSNAEIVAARGTYTTLLNRLDDLKVGGRNLLLNYSFNNGFNNWIRGVWALSSEKYRGNNVATITSTAEREIGQIVFNVKPNTKYSMSVVVKTTKLTGLYAVEKKADGNSTYVLANNETIIPVSADWIKVKRTFTTQPDTAIIRFAVSVNPSSTTSIAMCQLEESTLIGDASPAPEDVDAALALKQPITDNTFTTTNKTVPGAINEINNKIPSIWYHGIHSVDRSVMSAMGVLINTEVPLKIATDGSTPCVEYVKSGCLVHDASLGSYFKAPVSGYYTFKGAAYLSPRINTATYIMPFLKTCNIDTGETNIIRRSNLLNGASDEFTFVITLYVLFNQRIRFNILNIAASTDTANAFINQLTIIKETI